MSARMPPSGNPRRHCRPFAGRGLQIEPAPQRLHPFTDAEETELRGEGGGRFNISRIEARALVLHRDTQPCPAPVPPVSWLCPTANV